MHEGIIRTYADHVIAIQAYAEKGYSPDVLKIDIDFSGDHETQEQCVEAFKKSMSKVIKGLAEIGISKSAITNDQFAVTPGYRYLYAKDDSDDYRLSDENLYVRKKVPDGYSYESSASCERAYSGNTEEVEKIWQILAGCGDEMSFRLTFDIADRESAEDELIGLLIDKAQKKARLYSEAAGCKLGDVLHLDASEYFEFTRMKSSFGEEGYYAPLFNPEPVVVKCKANIEWELR